jgi:hypothetical protein
LDETLKTCPNLERMLLLETDVTSKVYKPFARLNVLEPQDWQTVDPPAEEEEAVQDEAGNEGEATGSDTVSAEATTTATPTTSDTTASPSSTSTSSTSSTSSPSTPPPIPHTLEVGNNIETMSHVVCFNNIKPEEAHSQPRSRHEQVIDTRWVTEALTGKEETREDKDFGRSYTWSWTGDTIPSYENLWVALKQPSTLIPPEA